ncbi:MAG: glycoside hydrolase family 2 TIM barrel-domain containing protein [Niabella sp.]
MQRKYRSACTLKYRTGVLLLLFLPVLFNKVCAQREGGMTTSNFDFDWRFHLGDITDASAVSFNDNQWRMLDLPHDWSIEQPFDLNAPSGWQGGYLPGGVGWYRKTFQWNKQSGTRVMIQFDGVYMNSEVWVNGHYLGKRPYGYISFEYDISPYLKTGKNIIAVRADNSKLPSGRWYTGSGIYRHVWLRVTGDVYIPQWGTYVTTSRVTSQSALVNIQTELLNRHTAAQLVTLQTDIFSPEGKRLQTRSQQLRLDSGITNLSQQIVLPQPRFWSPETPVRYRVVHHIIRPGNNNEVYTTYFGVRTIEVNATDGFVLNGKKIKLNGVCNHHDAGPVGAAVPEDMLVRRLRLLKEMGANAIRTTHNPAAPELYTICDTLGLMVLDEAFDGWDKPKAAYDYGLYFKEWWRKDLTDFIKRDRDHPSIVMWSIGNEVPKFEVALQQQLVALLKGLDSTRPVTQARSGEGGYADVAGLNGEGEMPGVLEKYHQQHPQVPLLGTEITHTLQTRGVYYTRTSYRTRDFAAPWEKDVKWEDFKDKVFPIPDISEKEVFEQQPRFYQSSYDNAIVRIGVRDQHRRTEALPYFIGTFRWTGFDYLGEATIQPARTANFGILDLCGFPKDHYYLYQSLWSSSPMVHLLPHWTHPGKEGTVIPVVAYSNAPEVELFLNNRSLGTQTMGAEGQLVWMVPYESGTLQATARKDGKTVARTSVMTAGAPAAIRLIADRRRVIADRRSVIHVEVNITDHKGYLAPEADNLVTFKLSGPGKMIGVENGDIVDFGHMKAKQRKAFKGKCLVLIQATGHTGLIKLTTSSEGLKSRTLAFTSALE